MKITALTTLLTVLVTSNGELSDGNDGQARASWDLEGMDFVGPEANVFIDLGEAPDTGYRFIIEAGNILEAELLFKSKEQEFWSTFDELQQMIEGETKRIENRTMFPLFRAFGQPLWFAGPELKQKRKAAKQKEKSLRKAKRNLERVMKAFVRQSKRRSKQFSPLLYAALYQKEERDRTVGTLRSIYKNELNKTLPHSIDWNRMPQTQVRIY